MFVATKKRIVEGTGSKPEAIVSSIVSAPLGRGSVAASSHSEPQPHYKAAVGYKSRGIVEISKQ